MLRALIIGQSHVNAITRALGRPAARYDEVSVRRLAEKGGSDRGGLLLADAMALLRELPEEVFVFVLVLGTYHNQLGLLQVGEEFDFFVSADDPVDPGAKVRIPHRIMARLYEDVFAESPSVRKLRSSARGRVGLISSPPPKQDNDFIMYQLVKSEKIERSGKTIDEIRLGRPETRLKLWALETRLLASWATSQGMSFVPPPAEAFNDDGFLKEDLYFDDATHANAGYGALVLDQILTMTESGVKATADA